VSDILFLWDTLYRLDFPVVVIVVASTMFSSGSTHSGHYTAYIRDVDNLGNWTHPVSYIAISKGT